MAIKKTETRATRSIDIMVLICKMWEHDFIRTFLHYIMEACAEKTLINFDRPNPNGRTVDGPILEKEFSSFVGIQFLCFTE
jgi:uncharacterized protein YbbC (DUF1343 family)